MAQQTAVEWLIEQLIPKAMATYDQTTYNAIQQAKEMYDAELMAKFGEGYNEGLWDADNK
jgi:hypothetical protein